MHWRFGITCVACDAGISRPEDCSRSFIAWPEHRNTSDHHHGHWMHESYCKFFTMASWVLHGSFIFKAPMTFDILCIIPFSTPHFLNDKWPAWNPALACHDHKDLRSASDAAETDRTFLSVGFRFFGVGPVASPLVSVWWGHLCWLACKCPHLGSSIRLSDMSKVVERVGPPSFSADRNRLKNPLLISFHAICDFYKRLIADSCWFIQLQGRISYHEQIRSVLGWRSQFIHPKITSNPERSQFEMSGGQFLLVSPFSCTIFVHIFSVNLRLLLISGMIDTRLGFMKGS